MSNPDGEPHKKPRRRRATKARMPKDLEHMKSALKKLGQYFSAGRKDEVMAIAESNNIQISDRAIQDYIVFAKDKNYDRIANGNKFFEVIRLADELAPLNNTKYQIYNFINEELGGSPARVKELIIYRANYKFYHNFEAERMFDSGAEELKINVTHNGSMASFSFDYTVGDEAIKCGGFFFEKNGCLYMLDISKKSVFFAKFSSVMDPKKEIIRGFAFFEQTNKKKVQLSPVVLEHEKMEIGKDQEERKQLQLGMSADQFVNK